MLSAIATAFWALHDFFNPLGSLHVQLVAAENTVCLRGVTWSERCGAPPQYLRGVLRLVVHRGSVALDSISVRFIGRCIDNVYKKSLPKSISQRAKDVLIDETLRYSTDGGRLLKGTYIIPFQFRLDPCLPESLYSAFAQRKYTIEVNARQRKSIRSETLMALELIKVQRTALLDSSYHNDFLQTRGNWHGILPYTVGVSTRVCQLGGTITVNLETFPDLSIPFGAVLKHLRVSIQQKIRCPTADDHGELTGDHTIFPLVRHLKYQKFDEIQDPHEPFKLSWTVRIPDFGIQPYTSNLDEHDPYQDPGRIRISHSLLLTFGFRSLVQTAGPASSMDDTTVDTSLDYEDLDMTRSSSLDSNLTTTTTIGTTPSTPGSVVSEKFQKLEETDTNVTFRAPIFIVSGDPVVEPPPVYQDNEHSVSQGPKSFVWLCSNGKYEVEHPPLYT